MDSAAAKRTRTHRRGADAKFGAQLDGLQVSPLAQSVALAVEGAGPALSSPDGADAALGERIAPRVPGVRAG